MGKASARSYARAAFEMALVASAVDSWDVFLQKLAEVFQEPMIRGVVLDPKLGSSWLSQNLCDLLSSSLSQTQKNFILLMGEHRRLIDAPLIAQEFSRLRALNEGVLEVQVSSAQALSSPIQERLMAKLKQRFGKNTIRVDWLCDPTLLAGAVIRVGDQVIDGSLQGRLQRLSQQLSQQG